MASSSHAHALHAHRHIQPPPPPPPPPQPLRTPSVSTLHHIHRQLGDTPLPSDGGGGDGSGDGGGDGGGDARAFVFSSQTLLSLPTMAFCFASQPLFPPALETLHQPATYNFMHSVVSTTM